MRKQDEAIIGTFELTGPRLIASDPCYERDNGCQTVVDGCVPGTWVASVVYEKRPMWGERVSLLRVEHQHQARRDRIERWESVYEGVPVDSGQAGIYDEARYQMDGKGEYGVDGSWYGEACKLTHNEDGGREDVPYFQAGIFIIYGGPLGVVSSSGYGDGCYDLRVGKDKDGRVVALEIIFIGEEDEDGDDEES